MDKAAPRACVALTVPDGRSLTARQAGRRMDNLGRSLMKFVQGDSVWQLIDEAAPAGANVIATLRSEVEVLALGEFCQFYLRGSVPEHFPVRHNGNDYTVTPLGAPGEKLALVIRGDALSSTVATEFRMADSGTAD